MIKKHSLVMFREIPEGCLFRVMKPQIAPMSGREILNDGVYLKIGNSHSVDVSNHKDAIFDLGALCRVLTRGLETWKQELLNKFSKA